MRALLDANVFLSFLLSSDALASATGIILHAAANGRFTLLFSPGVADEVKAKVRERPDLARKIALAEADRLLASIADLALVITPSIDRIPEMGRDRKDDYLIADAVVAGADFLVT
ncbi:MAG TPA: putative toxin-antitoxin system toxin component, PIN family, partial [Thermomicrobiales bacterium]|nr:putative toxin-antitoxin system toxin component, PIN family [Thermomicrobiales bacterium]